LVALLAEHASPAGAAAALIESLSKTAAPLAAGRAAAADVVSSQVITLVQGVQRAMFLAKLKMVFAIVVALGFAGSGTVAYLQHAGAADPSAAQGPRVQANQIKPAAPVRPGIEQAIFEEAPKQPAVEPKTPTEKLWQELSSTDETKVFQAILGLAATPKETLAFFKENLRPVAVDGKRVAKLLADLDSADFAVRQKAEEELEYLGKYIKPQLREALDKNPALEVRQRIEKLLKQVPFDPMDEITDLYKQLQKDPNSVELRKKLIAALQKDANGKHIAGLAGAYQLEPVIVTRIGQPAMPAPAQAVKGPSPTWLRAKRAIAVLEHIKNPEARQLLESLAQGEADALPTKEAKAALERLNK
jgi:hypothetical protein